MTKSPIVDSVRDKIQRFLSEDVTNVIRERLGGAYQEIKSYLEDLKEKSELTLKVLDQLPIEVLAEIEDSFSDVLTRIAYAKSFDDSTYLSNRSIIYDSFDKNAEGVRKWWYKVSSLIEKKHTSEEISERLGQVKKLYEDVQETRESSQKAAKEIDDLKKTLSEQITVVEKRFKDFTPKGELIIQQDIFSGEARKNLNSSMWWLFGIILSVIGLIVLIFWLFKTFCFEADCIKLDAISQFELKNCESCGRTILIYEIVKSIVLRILIISLAVYLVTFCIKNYNASRHNYVVNTHKANSMAAAVSLISGAITDSGRDSIILQAAQAIFSHQNSGFIGKDNEPSNPIIIENLLNKIKPG